MKTDISQSIIAYWNDIRGTNTVPTRSDLKPGPISHLLPDLFVLQEDGADVTFRLAGTRVCTILGKELRARSFTALFPPQQRQAMASLIHNVTEYRKPVIVDVTGYRRDHDALHFEMVLLPVADNDQLGCRVVGSLAPEFTLSWQLLEAVSLLRADRIRPVLTDESAEHAPQQNRSGGGFLAALRKFSMLSRKENTNSMS